MNTYDYYKNQATRELYYNQKLFVEKDENGNTTVTVEVEGNTTPWIVKKGVWMVKEIAGATQYIPEGDPRFDENAIVKMVWGRYETNKEAQIAYLRSIAD